MNDPTPCRTGIEAASAVAHVRLGRRIRDGIRFVIGAAILWVAALVIAVFFYSDRSGFSGVAGAGASIAAVTLVAFVANHLLRFARWQWMLGRLDARVPWPASLAIFMAGLGLLPTPGKAGVAVRSLFLERYGVRLRTSLAAYFAERLFDLLGLLLLAVAFYRGPLSEQIVGIAIVSLIAIVLIARYPTAMVRTLRSAVDGWTKATLIVDTMGGLLHAAARLFAWRIGLGFLALGMLANVVVGLLVWSIATMLTASIPAETGVGAVAIAHLSGSASMMPGGLGPFEIALLLDLRHIGMVQGDAVVVVACVRIVTLWGAVIVGLPLLLALLRTTRR